MDKISSSRARRLKPSRMQLSHHSSLLTRLRNRELFDEEETNQMQEEIKEVERTLRQIESKDVNELSISSNNRYTILKEHPALCHASLAPVYRLPAEIFSEIYHIILAIAHDSFPRPTEQLDPTRALISLAHVCSFWRKTCFFTVTLWCDIRIPSLFRNAGNARLVEMHLQYSGSSPLDIQIHNSGSKSNQTTANAILEGLFLNHERWRKIAIVGKNSWTELHSVCSRIYNAV
ncbi:hypothetical protein BDP27DRAFT_1030730 [Rhodocollybia butyracea]|uniref:F-box domain-containing protein n=1 Tax=Rhodocollybia butyracea TaxID=206335 RepID=A0A9P5PZD0_9AGAR|nr:hypothetical protein BDP27DRAFT_1030730 [Rhodocollybia butyracea]